jgi:Zn-dependent protease with chaperone function
VKGPSLAIRAVWVVLAAAGFWVLAVGLVGALVCAGLAIQIYAPERTPAAFAAWALAFVLLLGFMPRLSLKERNDEAPRLGPNDHPRFQAFVRDVARRAGAKAPQAIYLFHGANAFAGARRARWHARRESVIGVGLPLLALLTETEIRSVLAHEMGHHVRGDVKLGPWVHRTRRAIVRAVDHLDGSSFWLHLPFVAYAWFFLKTSLRISREQELAADAVAAQVAGPSATASALRKLDVLAAAWDAFFYGEVVPIVACGRLPPLLEGFERYWRAAQTLGTPAFEALAVGIEAAQATRHDDTHPSLTERIAALGDPPPLSDYAPTALGLLDHLAVVEEKVIRDILRDERAPLAPVPWDVVAEEVWLPLWRDRTANIRALERANVTDLPAAWENWEQIARETRRGPAIASVGAERKRLEHLMGTWLAVRLFDAGFRVSAPPGLAVVAQRGDLAVEPLRLAADLASGKLDAPGWPELCRQLGAGVAEAR